MNPRLLVAVASVRDARFSAPSALEALCLEDRARALAHQPPPDRLRFVAGRTLLASTYRSLTGQPLPAIVLGANARPQLADMPAWQFSVSHSQNAVGVALSSAGRVGLDIELKRALDPASVAVAFSEVEMAKFGQMPPSAAAEACLELWTTKEASAKFLSCPAALDVRSLPATNSFCMIKQWTLTLEAETYSLCLAYEGDAEIEIEKESAYFS